MTDTLMKMKAMQAKMMQSHRRFLREGFPSYADDFEQDAILLGCAITALEQAAQDAEGIEARVQAWCVECFGETTANDVVERTWRFLEEALELVQSLEGSKDDVLKMVDYTFYREKGEPYQELGGTMVTLGALCAARGMSMKAAFETEFSRINAPEAIEKIRAKHATKPRKSPLPGDYKHAVQVS